MFYPYFCLLVFGIVVTLVAWFSFRFFFRLSHLALQNVNKDHVIFLYFCNFAAKSDQKTKMGWRQIWYLRSNCFCVFLEELRIPKSPFEINWPLMSMPAKANQQCGALVLGSPIIWVGSLKGFLFSFFYKWITEY